MAERDPLTGVKWKDRYGIAFGKKLKRTGNIEAHLSYSKLHRTGKLLRGLSSRVSHSGLYANVSLFNRVKYAEEHEKGVATSRVVKIKAPYVRGGANTVITGGNITARPFMNPSKKILKMPISLIHKKMRTFGWETGAG